MTSKFKKCSLIINKTIITTLTKSRSINSIKLCQTN